MNVQQAVTAAVEWAAATCGIHSTYDHDTPVKSQPLPDVLGECTDHARIVNPDPAEWPLLALQSGVAEVYAIELSFMAEITSFDDPDAARSAALELREFDRLLGEAKANDGTLGGRVQAVSQSHRFYNRPGFVEFEDGTRGREMRLQLGIGEMVDAD